MRKLFFIFTVLFTAILFSCNLGQNNLSEYYVVHLQQNIEDDEYTEVERETLTGLEGSFSEAVEKSYKGFTVQPVVQEKISAKKEIQIKYDRIPVTFKLNLAGGVGETSVTHKYGTPVTKNTLPEPVLEGASFACWMPELPETFTENGTYTANWNFTYYKVKYLFENIDDDNYSEVEEYPEQIFYGTLGQIINFTPEFINSFEAKPVENQELKEEGQIITVYYDRKIVTLFIDLDGGNGNSYVKGKAGAAVTEALFGDITRKGYNNSGFDKDLPQKFNVEDNNKVIAKVLWIGEGEARYGIKFYKQSKYSSENAYYEAPELKQKAKGKIGELTKVEYDEVSNLYIIDGTPISILGFHPVAEDSGYAFENKKILGDETTVVKIYLDRNVSTYTFDFAGGIAVNGESNIITGRYEEVVAIPELVKPGYTRDSALWINPDVDLVYFPALPEEKRYIAKWNVNHYTVKYDYNIPEGSIPLKDTPTPITAFEYDQAQKNPDGWISRAFHTFMGLNTKADGTGIQINPDEDIWNLTEVDGEEVTLYCQWKPYKAPEFNNFRVDKVDDFKEYKLQYDTLPYSTDEDAYLNDQDSYLYVYLNGELVNDTRLASYNLDSCRKIKEYKDLESSKKYTTYARIIYKYRKDDVVYTLEGGVSPEVEFYSKLDNFKSTKFVGNSSNSVSIEVGMPEAGDGFSKVEVICNKNDGTSVTFEADGTFIPGQKNIIEVTGLDKDTYYDCVVHVADKHENDLWLSSYTPIKAYTTPELKPGEACIGQIYYDDDTWSTIYMEDKTPVGIVLAVNEDCKPTRIFSYKFMFSSYTYSNRPDLGWSSSHNYGTNNKFNKGWSYPYFNDLAILPTNDYAHKSVASIATIPGFETQRKMTGNIIYTSSTNYINIVNGSKFTPYSGCYSSVIHIRDITN